MLYSKVNYTADISYLNNVFIYEFDISKCNINVLRTKGCIDEATYTYLYNAERMVRQVYIGKMLKDNEKLYEILKNGIIEAKRMFFEANGIEDHDVLSIKNDAVFIINKQIKYTEFGLIKFVCKNVYTSFYKLKGMEFYYFYSNATREERIDIKGISDSSIQLHNGYFLDVIKDLFFSIQCQGPEIAMRMMKDIYNKYISLSFPIEYYREFNIESMYYLKIHTGFNTGYKLDNVTEEYKPMINITNNLSILMELQRIIIMMFFNK